MSRRNQIQITYFTQFVKRLYKTPGISSITCLVPSTTRKKKLQSITISFILENKFPISRRKTNWQKFSCFWYAVSCDSKVTFKIISKFYATAHTQFNSDLHEKYNGYLMQHESQDVLLPYFFFFFTSHHFGSGTHFVHWLAQNSHIRFRVLKKLLIFFLLESQVSDCSEQIQQLFISQKCHGVLVLYFNITVLLMPSH